MLMSGVMYRVIAPYEDKKQHNKLSSPPESQIKYV